MLCISWSIYNYLQQVRGTHDDVLKRAHAQLDMFQDTPAISLPAFVPFNMQKWAHWQLFLFAVIAAKNHLEVLLVKWSSTVVIACYLYAGPTMPDGCSSAASDRRPPDQNV